MAKKQKQKKWIKFRHKVIRFILYPFFEIYSKLAYGVKIDKFKEDKKRPYLILLNHQTAFDQFFVSVAFDRPVYYLATEDIFSNGFVSKLIKFLVAPIPIKKQTTDVRAIMTCLRVAKEGGSIAIAPEGNRTFSGKTEYMSPSIVPLARKLGLPIALYKIEGGYGVHPRWSDVVRGGKMFCGVSRIVEPEDYKDLSDEELFALIKDGLYVNEANSDATFKHANKAEYLERALYVCRKCGLSDFESRGNKFTCKKCGESVEYTEGKRFVFEDGTPFEFEYVADWYDYQNKYISELDIAPYYDTVISKDKLSVKEVILYKKKVPVFKSADISLFANKIVLNAGEEALEMPFDEISSLTILGKNKLNVYFGGKIYQLKGEKRFCAVKYVNLYNKYLNVKKGEPSSTYLGL